MMTDATIQTNLRVLSNSAASSTRVASTDHVRIEVLRCLSDATVQWHVPETMLGLMWARDRRGSVRLILSGRPMENLSAGEANLWFVPEGYGAEGELLGRPASDCVGLFVEPSFVPLSVKNGLSEPIVGFSDGALRRAFNVLAGQLAEPEEPQPLYLEGWAMQVLAQVRRAGQAVQSGSPRRMSGLAPWQLRRAKEMLLADISENLPLTSVAAACRLSVSHFSRAFRISTGTPPHQWLTAARVNNARDLLGQSETSLAEVATMCGFADQSHFSRLFARVHGMSPGKWRREQRV